MAKEKSSKEESQHAREESKHLKEEAKLAKRASKHDKHERLRRLSSDFDKTDDEGNPKKHRFKAAIAATVGAAKKLGKKKSRRERHNVIHIEEPPLSEHEKQQVSEFRTMLQEAELLPARHDDYHTLLRFIRARKHDLVAAREMWKNYIEWRQEFGTDTIEKDFSFDELDQVKEHYPQGHHGVDREGCPVYIELIGKVDAHKVLKHTTMERYLKYHVKEFERMFSTKFPAASIACGRHIEQSTSIMDADGVGFKSLNKQARTLIQAIAAIDGSYYPETMRRMLIINAGPALRSIWSVVKGWIDPVTVKKITVLGNKYQKELFEYIDPSQLPDFLGGTCHCECKGGCLSSDKGPWTDPTILQHLALQQAAHGRLSNGYGHRLLDSQGSEGFGHSTDEEETEDERSPQFRKDRSMFRQLSGMSRNDSNIPESGDEAQSAMQGPHLTTIMSAGAQSEESTPRGSPSKSLIEAVAAEEYKRMVGKPSNLKPLSPKPLSPKPTPLELPEDRPEPSGAGRSAVEIEKGVVSGLGGELRESEAAGTPDSTTVKLKASSWSSRRSLSEGRGRNVRSLSEGRDRDKDGGPSDAAARKSGTGSSAEESKPGSRNPLSGFFLTRLLPALASVWSFCVRQLSDLTRVGGGSVKQKVDTTGGARGVQAAGVVSGAGIQGREGRAGERVDAQVGASGALIERLQSLEQQVRTLTVSLTRPNSPDPRQLSPAGGGPSGETHKKVESLELELETTKQEVRRLLNKQNELESLIKEIPANRKFACF